MHINRSLADLESNIASDSALIITGLRGIGKTRLAIQYAHEHRDLYALSWIITIGDEGDFDSILSSGFAQLASELRLIEDHKIQELKSGNSDLVRLIITKLEEKCDPWLLIFDNIKNPKAIKSYIPKKGIGHIIITSPRKNIWRNLGHEITLGPFKPLESKQLLFQFMGRNNPDEKENSDAEILIEMLDNLPLAVGQAGAFINYRHYAITEYLNRFKELPAKLLDKKIDDEYPYSTKKVFELTLNEFKKDFENRGKLGIIIINTFSFFNADIIPKIILNFDIWKQSDTTMLNDFNLIDFDEAIGDILSGSIFYDQENSYSMNRIVQIVAQEMLDDNEKRDFALLSQNILHRLFKFDYNDKSTFNICSMTFPHVASLFKHLKELNVCSAITTELLNSMGNYLRTIGNLNKSLYYQKEAYRIDKDLDKDNYSSLARDTFYLAGILRQMGKHIDSIERFKESYQYSLNLEGIEKNKTMIKILNSMGLLLGDTGNYDSALECFNESLDIISHLEEKNDTLIAGVEINIGQTLQELGNYEEAKKHYERSLAIYKDALPENSLEAIKCENLLGRILIQFGDYDAARRILVRSIRKYKIYFGEIYTPSMSNTLNDLGLAIKSTGRLKGALKCFERAQKINEKIFGTQALSRNQVKLSFLLAINCLIPDIIANVVA